MIIFKKTRKITDIKSVSNHDAQGQKANNRSYQKDSKKVLSLKSSHSSLFLQESMVEFTFLKGLLAG